MLAYLYELMPNLFRKRQLVLETCHKVGFVSDDLWLILAVIKPRFNGSMVAIQSVDDHRGNQERSRRQLRGIINHPGMTLKRTSR